MMGKRVCAVEVMVVWCESLNCMRKFTLRKMPINWPVKEKLDLLFSACLCKLAYHIAFPFLLQKLMMIVVSVVCKEDVDEKYDD